MLNRSILVALHITNKYIHLIFNYNIMNNFNISTLKKLENFLKVKNYSNKTIKCYIFS